MESSSSTFDPDNLKPASRCHPYDANLITSEVETENGAQHIVQLDLDAEHYYAPSSTEGHGHLYINRILLFDDYVELLTMLAKFGIIQKGFLESTKARGYSALRPPGMNKDDPKANVGLVKDDIVTQQGIKKDVYVINVAPFYTMEISHSALSMESKVELFFHEKTVKTMVLTDESIFSCDWGDIVEDISSRTGVPLIIAEQAASIILGQIKQKIDVPDHIIENLNKKDNKEELHAPAFEEFKNPNFIVEYKWGGPVALNNIEQYHEGYHNGEPMPTGMSYAEYKQSMAYYQQYQPYLQGNLNINEEK